MKAFLKSSDGVFMLRAKVTTIGRHEDSDLVLKSVGIEDHHAVIEFSDSENSYVLQDFNSLHGTFINDCHIQNAAVKVGAGDILRFGSGGTSYELVIENTSQMSCPPMKHRTAWPGQLQLISETKLYIPSTAPPQLPFLQSQHPSSVHNSWIHGTNGTTPHPPNRKRPVSAWGRSMTSSFSPDTFSRPTAVRQGNGQSGASGVPLSGSHHMDLLLQEKDEIILKMKDEISRLLGFESESKHKDTVIANLRDEIAVMTKKMAQAARNDVEFTQKLLTFERDIETKTGEIKALKEQISNLQRDSSQVLCHSLSERDLEIANLKKEGEKLRRNQALTTGLVTSLQRDISAKEQRILQLKLNADKLKKENREKDNQLAVISAKCSRIKEEMKHEFREREVITYQNRIGELELQVKGLQGEMQKNCTEQEIITSRLAEKTKAEEELKKECERKCLQLQEMGRREGLIKADLDQAKAQLECFKRQMIEIFYSQEVEIPETVTDQQLMEKIRQITNENLQNHEEEKLLQEEISSKDSEEKEVSESVEMLKKSLDEFQVFLNTSYCSSSLKREICNLQDLCIHPSVLWIHTPVVEILSSLLSWVEAMEQLLHDVGIDVSCSDKGMASYMKSLLENNHETVGRIQTLQAQLDKLQESQNSLLHEKLNELKVEHEKELQDKIKLILLEKEEENKKILDSAVAQEKDKLKESVEEEKKKVQHLENQWRHLTEVIELKMKEEEIVNAKLIEAVDSLEEARKREAMLQEHLLMQDKHLTLIQDENELLKQKIQKEIMEYKEQIKQHSETIVALEDKLLEATQHQKNIEEENLALQEKIESSISERASAVSIVCFTELSDNEEDHVLLIGELAAAQKEILSKQAIILGLKKDLSEAKARMSDMIGELSEKQKMELEQNLILVRSQESELNMLREKLFEMSDLVDKKDKDLRTSAEELRHAKEKLKKLKNAAKEKESEFEKLPQTDMQASNTTKDEVPKTKKKQNLDFADLGAKCKGLRHEETIQRQKTALTELRDRIKTLEKTQSLTVKEKVPEPLIVLKKDLSEKIAQKICLEKERVPSSIKKMEAKLPSHFPNTYSNVALERTAKLEMSDALDLSEKLYLNLIHALGSLMNVKELTGVQSVKHLSQDEREKVRMQRQKDLELLYNKISKLKSRLERKEELLKEYESDIGQLRANKVSLQAYQAEMTKLEDEVYREAEENALLKEALERTQFQLNQEKRLNRAVKLHKSHLEELEKRSEKLSPCCTCSQKDRARKFGPKTKSFPEKLKTTDHVIETFKRRAHSNATS
ncbi:forkhead-associated domain-containing protein 1 isoform X2 [Dermochelys coriacea]|uniref:forkhead-associated domain-containing protein 1 isoform X2 n=2 Tax=Dermochelys coriacea TaxID=27794 RepID=UPI001CA9C574|nr:forkhead-associated domain-containing protein 1 isoform X2 [Dermochelys coriacea]